MLLFLIILCLCLSFAILYNFHGNYYLHKFMSTSLYGYIINRVAKNKLLLSNNSQDIDKFLSYNKKYLSENNLLKLTQKSEIIKIDNNW